MDGDGQQELLAAVDQRLYLYRGGPDGLQLDQTVPLGGVAEVFDVLVTDWDGDGDGDDDAFVPLHREEGSSVGHPWLRNDAGTLSLQPAVLGGSTVGALKAAGDLDGDGRAELIGWLWQRDAPPDVVVHSRDASGTWQRRDYSSSQPIWWINHLAVADVTGDGRTDIVATTSVRGPDAYSTLEVFAQQPDGSFGTSVVYPTWWNVDAVTTADLNGDGRDDVALTHSGFDAVGVYQQTADGTLQAERRVGVFDPAVTMRAAPCRSRTWTPTDIRTWCSRRTTTACK